jgi:DNA segregation ATPase FtsK/SpoIIIE, S-DNA-T family
MPGPIIFEGNEMAHLMNSQKVRELIEHTDWPNRKTIDLFLGEPIAIRDPIAARIRRQSGGHLLILSRNEEEGVGMCMAAILSILCQAAPSAATVVIADFTLAESEWSEHAKDIQRLFPHPTRVLSRQREVAMAVQGLAKMVLERNGGEGVEEVSGVKLPSGQPRIYLVLQGLHRMKALRTDDESFMYDDDPVTPSAHLATILRDGPEVGIHVIAWCDTWSNAGRAVTSRVMSNFGLRAGGVMSVDDSQRVFDDSAASKLDKPHRVIFSDDERPGQLEKFRPYAMPRKEWLADVGGKLAARASS